MRVLICLFLSGCAGHQAMVIDRPKPPPKCEIKVCEKTVGRGCWKEYCTTNDGLGRILEDIL
jgi:hypothetical protein